MSRRRTGFRGLAGAEMAGHAARDRNLRMAGAAAPRWASNVTIERSRAEGTQPGWPAATSPGSCWRKALCLDHPAGLRRIPWTKSAKGFVDRDEPGPETGDPAGSRRAGGIFFHRASGAAGATTIRRQVRASGAGNARRRAQRPWRFITATIGPRDVEQYPRPELVNSTWGGDRRDRNFHGDVKPGVKLGKRARAGISNIPAVGAGAAFREIQPTGIVIARGAIRPGDRRPGRGELRART